MAAPKLISLLPREGFTFTTAGRALAWALNVGRIIVIITELIVIIAFFSRFWLDRQLTNLNKKIEQQTQILRASQQTEKQFRSLQSKLTSFNLITEKFPNYPAFTQIILKTIPQEVSVSQLTIDKTQIQITGFALTEAGLQGFIQQLNQTQLGEAQLVDISADNLQQEFGLRFTVRIPLAEQKLTTGQKL